jgi:PIN domain nuclease of toxin-antitoxin system
MKQPAPVVGPARYLLDTHALLFMDQAPERLPESVRTLVADTRNQLFVSIASLWEIQIKCLTGKLTLTLPVDRLLQRQQRDNAVDVLPIDLAHVVEHTSLAQLHRDPFDRMLVAQARIEGLTILSRDQALSGYDVATRW